MADSSSAVATAPKRFLRLLIIAAVVGLGVFALMVWRAVEIETVEPAQAIQRFTALQASLPPGPPLLSLDDAGNVLRREEPRTTSPRPISRLRVLAYHAQSRRLVAADVALWFL